MGRSLIVNLRFPGLTMVAGESNADASETIHINDQQTQ